MSIQRLLLAAILLCAAIQAGADTDWKLLGVIEKPADIFTQGLEIHNGNLWFSSGKRGKSFLYFQSLAAPDKNQRFPIARKYFAEGLSIHNDQLVLLTWTSGKALRFQLPGMEALPGWRYHGQGWGLCFDGEFYWMSDGSNRLQKRDINFEVVDTLAVHAGGKPVNSLNELECFNGLIAANRWQSNDIYLISSSNGQAETLKLEALAKDHQQGVLNGLAWDHNKQELLVTGKYWNKVYRLKILLDLPHSDQNLNTQAPDNQIQQSRPINKTNNPDER